MNHEAPAKSDSAQLPPEQASEVVRILEDYMQQLEDGKPVRPQQLLERHPEYAEVLQVYLDQLDVLHFAAVNLRDSVPLPQTSSGDPLCELGQLGDFRLLRELGRGGMGVVYEAEQISLRRLVALKVLPFAAALDDRQLQRFHNEAQAAGHLHHTNIVPVFAVGQERGVHYFAMQLIEGQTLAALIKELRHGPHRQPAEKAASDANVRLAAEELVSGQWLCAAEAQKGAVDSEATGPFEPHEPQAKPSTTPRAATASTEHSTKDPAFFRTVAKLGIQAAEALEHAHQMGVIHRDIKPGNLMIDGRGDLWVTDFGLAQIQSDTRLTMTGDLLGTLRYMSPEQALAKRVVIDHRTDIYSLGVTLYELLTLEPVFSGKDRQEILRQIAFDEPVAPRRIGKTIPKDLETIVLKAMAKNPAERYATAQELADDLDRCLKDEPIRARRATLVQRAQRWARRHKPVVSALAAALVVLLAGSIGAAMWYMIDRVRLAEQALARRTTVERDGKTALDKADEYRNELHSRLQNRGDAWMLMNDLPAWKRLLELAQAEYRRAETLVKNADVQIDARLAARLKQLTMELASDERAYNFAFKLDQIQLEAGVLFVKGSKAPAAAAAKFTREFERAGLDVFREVPEALGSRIHDSRIRYCLIDALGFWATVEQDRAKRERLLQVAQHADSHVLRHRIYDSRIWHDLNALETLVGEIKVDDTSPQMVLLLGLLIHERGGNAERLLEAALFDRPNDFRLVYSLGNLASNPMDRKAYRKAALSLRPSNVLVYIRYADFLFSERKVVKAIEYYRKARNIDQKHAMVYNGLGNALYRQGKLDEAIKHYRKALEIRPKFANAHNGIGVILVDQEKVDEAIKHYQKAIAYEPKYVDAYNNLGAAKDVAGKLDEAIEHFEKALSIDPTYPFAHVNLGGIKKRRRQFKEAAEHFRNAIKSAPYFSMAYVKLADLLSEQNKLDDAVWHYHEALRIDRMDAEAHHGVAKVLSNQGKLDQAIKHYHEALRITPGNAYVHMNLGLALQDQKRLNAAIERYQKAVQLNPKLDKAHMNLGNARMEQGKLDEAVKHYQDALAVNPDYVKAHLGLGIVLEKQFKLDLAFEHYCKYLAIHPDADGVQNSLGNIARMQGKYEEALKNYQKACEFNLKDAMPHINCGAVLHKLGRFAEAKLHFQKAEKLGGKPWAAGVMFCERGFHLRRTEKLKPIADNVFRAGLEGRLTKNDPLDFELSRRVSYRKAYAVHLKAGTAYQMDVTGDFDTKLRIETQDFQVVLANDDVAPPKRLDSRMVFTPDKGGVYKIVVTSFGSRVTGSFELKVREVKAVSKPKLIDAALTTADKKRTKGQYFKLHHVKLIAGRPHTIKLTTKKFDSIVILRDASGKTINYNQTMPPGKFGSSRIDFTPPTTADYQIEVTSSGLGQTGAYLLRVQSYVKAPE